MKMHLARGGRIVEREVSRVTDKMVFIQGGRRYAKESTYESWHDTWEQAHAYLLSQAQGKVNALRLNLERANGDLGRIKGMKPPAGGDGGCR